MTHTLTICNVATSAMVRECELAYITRAGVEIGVASTKAFTAQLAGLFLLTLALAQVARPAQRARGSAPPQGHAPPAGGPASRAGAGAAGHRLVQDFARKENALFLGRGLHYPIALEGALKLKEISYIHAEAYPAGELKHGPLALVTSAMPVVTVAPNDALLEKLKSNMHEVRARGGVLYVLADADSRQKAAKGIHVIRMPEHYGELSPAACGAAATAGLPHGVCAWHGCRQAPEPGQDVGGVEVVFLRPDTGSSSPDVDARGFPFSAGRSRTWARQRVVT